MTRGEVESFREAFGETLVEIGEKIKEVVVLDADVAKSTRSCKFAEKFPDRFLQLGISEQDLIGTAAGLAIAGKVPIASAFSMFLLRAWEQIRNTVARDALNVKLIGTHAGLSDHLDGSSHQCLEDLAVMRVLPNMTVAVPADATATKSLLYDVVERKGPVYMRIGRDYAPRVYEAEEEVKLGKPNVIVDGDDVTILSCGVMVSIALDVAVKLRRRGISAMVVDLHTIKPIDEGFIVKSAKRIGRVVTVEEHSVLGGMGGAVAEVLSEKCPVKIKRIGVNDSFGTCSRSYLPLLEHYGLTSDIIARRVEEALK